MSSTRQVTLAAVGRYRMAAGGGFDEHSHARHQLSWSDDGPQHVRTDDAAWSVPTGEAMWIPGRVMHEITFAAPADVRLAYFQPSPLRHDWSRPLQVTLLPELVERLAAIDVAAGDEVTTPAVSLDLATALSPVAAEPRLVPADRSLVDQIVAYLSRRPDDRRTLADWGRELGASPRTLERGFRAQLGQPFVDVRRRSRLDAAVSHLADGVPVTRVAHLVGYGSASSFITAFRREFGHPPSRHFDG